MVRFHERGSLILGIVAIILSLLSIGEYRRILTGDLISLLFILFFLILSYMFVDNMAIYKISTYRGIIENDIKPPNTKLADENSIPNNIRNLAFQKHLPALKRMYLWEYLLFSFILCIVGIILGILFFPQNTYILLSWTLILTGMTMLSSYHFIEKAKTGFFVRISPETYLDIGRDAELTLTFMNYYKKAKVRIFLKVLFPKDVSVNIIKRGEKPLESHEFIRNFKINSPNKETSKNISTIKFSLSYTGSKDRFDKIYIEMWAFKNEQPIEEYQPKIYIIPLYLYHVEDDNF